MRTYLGLVTNAVRSALRSKHDLMLENLALRQQLAVLTRQRARTRTKPADRLFWSWLSRYWPGWRSTLVMLQPETVIRWQRTAWRGLWGTNIPSDLWARGAGWTASPLNRQRHRPKSSPTPSLAVYITSTGGLLNGRWNICAPQGLGDDGGKRLLHPYRVGLVLGLRSPNQGTGIPINTKKSATRGRWDCLRQAGSEPRPSYSSPPLRRAFRTPA